MSSNITPLRPRNINIRFSYRSASSVIPKPIIKSSTPHFSKIFQKEHHLINCKAHINSITKFTPIEANGHSNIFPAWKNTTDITSKVFQRRSLSSAASLPSSITIDRMLHQRKSSTHQWFYKTLQYEREASLRRSYKGFFPSTPHLRGSRKPYLKQPPITPLRSCLNVNANIIQLTSIDNYKVTLIKKNFPSKNYN
jgi:hypothetical protein